MSHFNDAGIVHVTLKTRLRIGHWVPKNKSEPMVQKAIKLQKDTLRVIKLAIFMLLPFWNGIYHTGIPL